MTTINNVELAGKVRTLDVPGYGPISFEALAREARDVLSGVKVTATRGETSIPSFAQRIISADPRKADHSPKFQCVYGDESSPFLALVGLREIAFLGPNMVVHTRHKLHRDIGADWGGFEHTILPRPTGFVFVYEAGVMSFGADGIPIWELELSPHDYLLSQDSQFLRFRSDEFSGYGKGDWLLRLDSGSRQ